MSFEREFIFENEIYFEQRLLFESIQEYYYGLVLVLSQVQGIIGSSGKFFKIL